MVSGYYDIINKTLGKGHYGVVKLGRHCLSGEPVAIKIIEKSRLNTDSLNQLGNEIKILFKLCEYEHPNILKLYQTIDTRGKLFLITEYCGPHACDLHDYILKKQNNRNGSGLKEIEAKIFFIQICSAISYCHSMGIVHRDLKPENILVTDYRHMQKISSISNKSSITTKIETEITPPISSSPITSTPKSQNPPKLTNAPTSACQELIDYTQVMQQSNNHNHNDKLVPKSLSYSNFPLIKLIDFGFANRWSRGEKMRTSCGTLAYSAPELLLGEPYDGTKVDVWGLGLMLYILIYGGNPFMQINDNETLTKILDCSFATPPKSNVDNTNVVDLLRSLIKRDPISRLTIDAILRHKWLEDIAKPIEHLKTLNYPLIIINNNNANKSTISTSDISVVNSNIGNISNSNNIDQLDNDRNSNSHNQHTNINDNNNNSNNQLNDILKETKETEDEQINLHDRVIQEMFKHPRFAGSRLAIETSLKASSLSHQNFDPRSKLTNDQYVVLKKKISSGLVRLLDPQRAREESHSGDESGSSLDQESLGFSQFGDHHHQQKIVVENVSASKESNTTASNNSTSNDDYVFATYHLTRDRIMRQAQGLIEPVPSVASPVPEAIPEEGGYSVTSGCYLPYGVGTGSGSRVGVGDMSIGSNSSSSSSHSLRIGGANSTAAALAYSLPLARKCSLVNEESGCSSSSELCSTREDDTISI